MRNLPQAQQERMLDMAQKAGMNAWSSDENYQVLKEATDLRFSPDAQDLAPDEVLRRTTNYLHVARATPEQINQVMANYADAGVLRTGRVEAQNFHSIPAPVGAGVDDIAGLDMRAAPFLGARSIDTGVIGIGNVLHKFGNFVEDSVVAKYTLEALDVASGPIMYGVRHIPAVENISQAVTSKVARFFADGFEGAGRSGGELENGAIGGTAVLAVGVSGFAGSIKAINNLTTDIKAISSLSRGEALRQKYSHLSSQERRAIINDRLENTAANRLKTLEQSIPGAHFQARHGAQTTLQQQYDRAVHGVDPATGQIRYRNDGSPVTPNSTRFMSNRDQINAIERATSIFESTGRKVDAEKPIVFKTQAGEGYYGGTGVYDTSFSAQVWFNNARQPITAFPILGR